MVKRKNSQAGSNDARNKKVRADRLPLRATVKSGLGCKRKLVLAEWNVRTLMDRAGSGRPERQTALVARELDNYGIDIAALSETRLAGYDSLVDGGYTFFWSGKDDSEKRESGVGFAIRNHIAKLLEQDPTPVNDRIMSMRIPLQGKVYATILSIYAPTMTNPEENKEAFYSQLRTLMSQIPKEDKLIITGDFNARVGSEQDKWKGVIGPHGIGSCNSNGELLLALCSENNLIITNTMFKHKNHHKTTWMHPRSKHWHLLDYVLTREKDRKDVLDTRAMRGADCATDHLMIRCRVNFEMRKSHNKTGTKPPSRLDTAQIKDPATKQKLIEDMDTALRNVQQDQENIEDQWKTPRLVRRE